MLSCFPVLRGHYLNHEGVEPMNKEAVQADMNEAQDIMHKLWAIGDRLNDKLENMPSDQLDGDFTEAEEREREALVELRDEVNNAGYSLELGLADAELAFLPSATARTERALRCGHF